MATCFEVADLGPNYDIHGNTGMVDGDGNVTGNIVMTESDNTDTVPVALVLVADACSHTVG